MKTFTRTIILLIVANLITAVSVMAQSPPAEDAKAAELQKSQADLAQREAEIAAKLAQRQAEVAQKQAEAVQKQVELAAVMAQAPAMPAPPSPRSSRRIDPFSVRSLNLPMWPRTGSVATALVIPSAEMTTEELIAVTEDLNVMSRIFKQNLQKAHITPVGTSPFLSDDDYIFRVGPDRGAIQSMYLQSYGVLFLMKVDFPLSPPAGVKQEEKAKEKKAEKTDPVWDQTRRRMFEPEAGEKEKSDEPKEKYDPQKVEDLKTTLVETLKHAANIRNLKSDESVILAVAGSGPTTGSRVVAVYGNNLLLKEGDSGGAFTTKWVEAASPHDIGLLSPAILVIRAKKSDIDGLAKGDLDAGQFRQHVQIISCPYWGAEAEQ